MNSLRVRFMSFDALLVDNLMVDLNAEINFDEGFSYATTGWNAILNNSLMAFEFCSFFRYI